MTDMSFKIVRFNNEFISNVIINTYHKSLTHPLLMSINKRVIKVIDYYNNILYDALKEDRHYEKYV